MPVVTGSTVATVYFTIVPTGAGFTDQMLQFSAFYRLGLSLGYSYQHVPFHSPRTSSGRLTTPLGRNSMRLGRVGMRLEQWLSPDIYGFLGFNEYFLSTAAKPNEKIEEVEVNLSDEVLARSDVNSLSELQAFIKERAVAQSGKDSAILVKFRLAGGRDFIGLIHDGISDYPDGLDFREVYFQARRARPWPSKFPKGAVRAMVHIRQGDTAVIRTPWDTYIPLRLRSGNRNTFVEYQSFSDIPGNVMRVSDFQSFVSGLCSHFDPGAFAKLFFSDGFDRSFETLDRQIDRLQLTADQLDTLRKSRRGYNRREFAPLASMLNSRRIIGESARQLCDLVHASVTADLIIIGPQQRMIPKLLANYCPYRAMPLVIALERDSHEGELVDYHRMLGFHARKDRFIYVNIDNPDYPYIVDRLVAAFPQLGHFRRCAGH